MTSCKHCLFKVMDNGIQTGCVADRISKMDKKMVHEDGEFHCETELFCNMYRNESWKNEDRSVEAAREEIQCTFGVIINVNSITEEFSEHIVSRLSSIEYDRKKVSVVLSHKNQLKNRKNKVAKIFRLRKEIEGLGYKCFILEGENESIQEVDSIRVCGNKMYVCITSKDFLIEPLDFKKIDESFNDELKEATICFNSNLEIFSLGAYVNLNYMKLGNYNNVVTQLFSESKEHGTCLQV